jgi:hypothetical protein
MKSPVGLGHFLCPSKQDSGQFLTIACPWSLFGDAFVGLVETSTVATFASQDKHFIKIWSKYN